MKNTTFIRSLFLSCLIATAASATSFEGPLAVKNGHPLYTAIGSPSLLSADPENAFDLGFSYSSIFRIRSSNDWYYGFDLETATTDLQVKRTVGTGTEIGIEVPIIRYGPGFMDGGIETFHDMIGLHNAYGRNDRPKNAFLLDVVHDGKVVVQGDPGKTGLGDIKLEGKQVVYHDRTAVVSVNAFMNVPTGDPDIAFGSGRTNGGLAVLVNERAGESVKLYANAGYGLIDELAARETLKLRNYYYGGIGLEWGYSRAISLSAQVFAQTSPFPKSDIYFIDDVSLLASFGGRYRNGAGSSFGFAMTEDPNTSGAPDVMFSFDYRNSF